MTASTAPVNPYVGPRPFETGERLYGRDREVLDLSELLLYKRFVLLHSPSGAGKSSLIQAGLIPLLKRKRLRVTQPPIRVNKEPPPDFVQAGHAYNRYLLSTCISLEEAFPEGQRTPLAQLAGLGLAEYLSLRQTKLSSSGAEKAESQEVLLFDQFEEIISLNPHDREAKQRFFAELGAVLGEYRHLALFAMREDFVAGLEDYLAPMPERLGVRFRIDLLGPAAAAQAIQLPAADQGVAFAADAAQALVRDLSQTSIQQADGSVVTLEGRFVEPVQLQVVCRRLWEARAQPDAIHLSDLDKLRAEVAAAPAAGSPAQTPSFVDQVLGNYYATKVAEVAAQAKVSERVIRNWFDQQLITPQGLRGQVLKTAGASQGLANEAIQALLDAYLVRKEERRGLTWFELAHDRLVRPIQADNRQWAAVNLQPFQQKAAAWAGQGEPPTLLLVGRELEEAQNWKGDLTADERRFIQKSWEAQQAAARERLTERGLNLADLGWGVIFAGDAPPALREALAELLDHRKRQATERRLEFYQEFSGPSRGYQRGETGRRFLARNGAGFGPTNPEKVPYYLLIVGDADAIPFEFQYDLDERYAVGRLWFEQLEDYARYARSVVLAETGQFALSRDLLVFAPQPADDRALQSAYQQMTQPMLEQLQRAHPDWQAQALAGAAATKAGLAEVLGGPRTPALLFTAAHSMTLKAGDPRQRPDQGAIICQDWPGAGGRPPAPAPEVYFAGADVSAQADLLGLVAFLWGDSTAGTPAESDFALRRSTRLAESAFVARLPQRLLGHPRGGALAIVGHVDAVWGSDFLDESMQPDFSALADTLDRLMRGHTVGSAVEALNQRYQNYRGLLSDELIRQVQQQALEPSSKLTNQITRTFSARNYIILGDPAARLPLEGGPVPARRPVIEPVAELGPARPAPEAAGGEASVRSAPAPGEALILNGLAAATGAYLLRLSPAALAKQVMEERPDGELLSELRWTIG
ncbi:MAG: hypothetical protein JNK29_01620 [Anaerolineales bacterium]|nr:hypothetical protein [Anaerolineales bacterium]